MSRDRRFSNQRSANSNEPIGDEKAYQDGSRDNLMVNANFKDKLTKEELAQVNPAIFELRDVMQADDDKFPPIEDSKVLDAGPRGMAGLEARLQEMATPEPEQPKDDGSQPVDAAEEWAGEGNPAEG